MTDWLVRVPGVAAEIVAYDGTEADAAARTATGIATKLREADMTTLDEFVREEWDRLIDEFDVADTEADVELLLVDMYDLADATRVWIEPLTDATEGG